MNFNLFCKYLEKLEETDSRLEMTTTLADLLRKASLGEIGSVCYLALGRLGPLFDNPQFNIASKMMIRAVSRSFEASEADVLGTFKKKGDLGTTAACLRNPQLAKIVPMTQSISEVYHLLLDIANDGGTGSQERKLRKIVHLLSLADNLSVKYIVRIVLGTLRTGSSEVTLLDALSWMVKGDKSARVPIEQAFNVFPDIGYIATLIKKDGLTALSSVNLKVGVPIKAQLCQRLNRPAEIIKRHGGVTAAEPKLDGTRVQLHCHTPFVKTFTRNLDETTHQFPEIIAEACRIKATSFILDGEAIGVDPKTGQLLSFQKTITRKRKHHVQEAALSVKLILIVFDILYLNGESLLSAPFIKRRQKLERLLTGGSSIVVGNQLQTGSAKELEQYFEEYTAGGGEGLVCKDLQSPYKAGGRGYSWIKFKNLNEDNLNDTIDCLVMGIYRGRGKRTKFGVGAFLAGVLDNAAGQYKTIAKIGTGLTDKEWEKLAKIGEKLQIKNKPRDYLVPKELTPDVWFSPKLVVSIRADNITKSPLHSAGKALRFPRLMAWREDKAPSDITTLNELTAIQP
ncbi:MAG: ATP-dependent DNA ligase [bacterium]